jgi:mannose-6-phosphate isomerase-like protein (cupin superfamily)
MKFIESPKILAAVGTRPKSIEEFAGRINTSTKDVSIARMLSPEGWTEPGQKPEFDEYSIVLNGILQVDTKDNKFIVKAGQAIIAEKGEWVRYSTPFPDGAEYISVCLPAFSPESVHRDTR